MRLAVVGSGVSGLASAHLLGPRHDVVLYEADDRLGGHANTVEVDDPKLGAVGVDTGFIVHNDRNYPHLIRLFDELAVPVVESEMSFAVHNHRDGFYYRATSLNTLFADRRRLVDQRMWRMLFDIARFYRLGRKLLRQAQTGDLSVWSKTIGSLLDDGGYGPEFIEAHLIPMGAAVWSAPPDRFRDFPAISLLRFLDNHGLLSVGNRPMWKTVAGGSRVYVDAIARHFKGEIRLASPVSAVERLGDGVLVTSNGQTERYDAVVLACHSDQSLRLLMDPSAGEERNLAAIGYQSNAAILHTDVGVLPPDQRAWAAWNYDVMSGTDRATVTYDITRLMRLDSCHRYLVTLNDPGRIDHRAIIAEIEYQHPVFDHAAVQAQERIRTSNGTNNTWFCGAWLGYGFHEDGMASAVEVARSLGAHW
ncbi:MAG: FAD-dependent oxidoreductase [Acidimicrobiia bacterium]|nr:FAD-dependent oxidoreductase [Acidimicrobiia bacterium]